MIQRDHLLFVRDRHLQWLAGTDNSKIREMHQTLFDLLGQVSSQYDNLIEALQTEKI